jgi:hypothetical protein
MRTLCVLVLAAAASVACDDPGESVDPGAVELAWRVGPFGCESAGTDEIEVTTLDGATDLDGRSRWTFDCSDRVGEIRRLPPGTYAFDLVAADGSGEPVFEGGTGPVEVRSGGTSTPDAVVLRASPGFVEVSWNFGGPLCSQVDVARVRLLAFDANQAQAAESTQPCEAGTSSLELPPGSYDLVVLGLPGAGGAPRYEKVVRVDVTRGQTELLQVLLTEVEPP